MARFAPKPKLIDKFVEMKKPGDMTQRITAAEDLFAITHIAIADVEVDNWRLTFAGMVDKEQSLAFEDLQQYPKKTIESIHKCAGYPWAPELATRQIANVKWGGVDLRDLLDQFGVFEGATHLWAYGLEYGSYKGVEQDHYVKDIPRSRIDEGDVLIAYELNGEPLSTKHGAPARLVVPGFYGTNCVKWLCRLEFQNCRADGMFTRVLYNDRDLVADPSGHTVKPIWEVEPESIIISPTADEQLTVRETEIWGWAWSNCAVRSVEVSVDGGQEWREATLEPRHQYGWQRFSLNWTPSGSGSFEIICRATDEAGIRQPMEGSRNSVHSITVAVN